MIRQIKSHGYESPYLTYGNCGEEKDYGSDLSAAVADISKNLHLSGSSGSTIFDMSFRHKRGEERREAIKTQRSLEEAFSKGNCKGVAYATHWGWTPGTGVWVLAGSKENHERLANLPSDPSLGWNSRLKLAGAAYYDHCA
jgi:hypothetical protein